MESGWEDTRPGHVGRVSKRGGTLETAAQYLQDWHEPGKRIRLPPSAALSSVDRFYSVVPILPPMWLYLGSEKVFVVREIRTAAVCTYIFPK